MGFEEFQEHLNRVAEEFSEIPKSEPIKLVSNLDADGISACAVMVKALKREGRNHSVRIIHQLREKEAAELAAEEFNNYIFTDLGSGALSLLEKHFKNRKVLVLDHHHPEGDSPVKVWHVNPHIFGIDGSADVSASGVVFFFCRTLDKRNEDMAHVALIGAIGDVQEKNGFHGLNRTIYDIAVEKGLITVKKGLKLFGRETRPLHKLLEYSSDISIPGVTNSESGAIQFLMSLGINPKNGSQWRLIGDLSEKERQSLTAGIIMRRAGKDAPEDIFTQIYNIPEEEGSFADLREFSTLLNACGRMGKAGVGVGACLGSKKFKQKALQTHVEYKKQIVAALRWYEENADKEKNVRKGDGYMIINARNEIMDTIIGTLASILSMSGNLADRTLILSIARKPDKVSKVSLRVVNNPENVHLREILARVAQEAGGECGGHQHAAGAIVPTEKEDEFLEVAERVLAEQARLLRTGTLEIVNK